VDVHRDGVRGGLDARAQQGGWAAAEVLALWPPDSR
jgi:hypothetical protein